MQKIKEYWVAILLIIIILLLANSYKRSYKGWKHVNNIQSHSILLLEENGRKDNIAQEEIKKEYSQYATTLSHYNQKSIKHDEVAIVTYSAGLPVYFANRSALIMSAHDQGIDRILTYTPNDIDEEFYRKNAHILNQKRGAGFWLWKPYIILDAMKRMPINSIIFYIDDDCYILKNISNLISLVKKHDRVLFKNFHSNSSYIKRDAYILMNSDSEHFYNATQLEGSFLLIKNTKANQIFIENWLKLSQDKRILTDIRSKLGNELPTFKDHRHEQAILTLLAMHNADEQVYVEHEERKKFIITHGNKDNLFPLINYLKLFNKGFQKG